jgi:hypothetical protein
VTLAGGEADPDAVILGALNYGRRSGAGTFTGALALMLATAAALLASATLGEPEARREATAGAEPTPRSIERQARRLTPLVARRIERIRGLRFARVPRPRVITAERFAEIAAREARRQPGLGRELAEAEASARLLGLMAPDEQLDALRGGAPDLAAAAWDTRRERLYVIADASGDDAALLEFLLAHELEHALSDQRFGLPEPQGVGDDAVLARLALIEGAATAAMIEYAARHLNPFALGAATAGLDPGTQGVPRFFVESLTWAYLRGAGFVNALREAGPGWQRVDAALSRPPQSTEQVLHPAAYLRGERPLPVVPDVSALRRRGWRVVGRGELGEFTTAQLLRLGAPRPVAAVAARGWGGDAYVLLSREPGSGGCERDCRRRRVLVVEWRWDSAAEAREFTRTLPAYLVGGLGAEPQGAGSWSLNRAWIASAAASATTRLAFAPSEGLARAAAELTQTSAGRAGPPRGRS